MYLQLGFKIDELVIQLIKTRCQHALLRHLKQKNFTSSRRLSHHFISLLLNIINIIVLLSHCYPRDSMLARVIAIATCLSVCLSVTRRYCVKTKKASDMVSSPSVSPKTLVFRRHISSPHSKGFPPNGGLKQGSVGKIQQFFSFKRQYLENGSRYGQSYY